MMPATSMIGGFYAKAKQRVLNRIGRRTSTYHLASSFLWLESNFCVV